MVKVRALEVPPPGVGLTTVTWGVPTLATSAAVIAAVSWVVLPKVVVLELPFQRTDEFATSPVPLTVSVKAGPPAVAPEGNSAVRAGAGLGAVETVKVRALEVPPPGVGLTTVTWGVPAAATSAAVIDAVTWVPLTRVVVRLFPFHLTVVPVTKLLPLTVRVNPPPPAAALPGAGA